LVFEKLVADAAAAADATKPATALANDDAEMCAPPGTTVAVAIDEPAAVARAPARAITSLRAVMMPVEILVPVP
jgi:hypothetical protein